MDDMVIAHVHKELDHPDHFDVMIVDILGLGEIGHVAGNYVILSHDFFLAIKNFFRKVQKVH